MKTTTTIFKKLLLAAIFLCSAGGFSQGRPAHPPCKILTATFNNTVKTTQYMSTYSGNKMTSLQSNKEKIAFTYDPMGYLIKTEKIDLKTNTPYLTFNFINNAQGKLIDKKTTISGTSTSYWYTYKYDPNGHLTDIIYKSFSNQMFNLVSYYKITWIGNNISEMIKYNASDNQICTASYKYDTTTQNKFNKDFAFFATADVYQDVDDYVNYLPENEILAIKNTCKGTQNFQNTNRVFNQSGYPLNSDYLGIPNYVRFTYDCQ